MNVIVTENPPIGWHARMMRSEEPLAEAIFSIAQIADAADIARDSVKTWFKRGVLTVDSAKYGQAPEAKGFGRILTGYTGLVIAIMARLTASGTDPDTAKMAAYDFVFWGDEERNPGFLFPTGSTVLCLSKAGGQPVVEIINVDGEDEWSKVFGFAKRSRGNYPSQCEFLVLDELWHGFTQRLGIRAILEDWEEKHRSRQKSPVRTVGYVDDR